MTTKKKKILYFESVFDFSIFVPKTVVSKKERIFTLNLNFFTFMFFFAEQKVILGQIISCRCPELADFAHIFSTTAQKILISPKFLRLEAIASLLPEVKAIFIIIKIPPAQIMLLQTRVFGFGPPLYTLLHAQGQLFMIAVFL